MKYSNIILLTITTIIFAGKTYPQATINLLDGKQISVTNIYDDTSSILLRYDFQKKNKIKRESIDKLEIYSIDYIDKSRKIIYRQDSTIGFPLTIGEMGNYILGEREAIKNYKAPWVTVGGFAVGAIASHYIQFWALTSSVAYGTGMALIGPKVKTSENISTDLKADKNFVNGYKDHATKLKVKNAILGTALGIAVYGITSAIIQAN